ncbi:DUF7010 family protein [Marinicella sediminis]|uniref:DUF7010 family protein n=1 Tax=Marinicella sediminis TaxID=1792834 RepID=A0ABV7JCM5_9GAMM|nr:hypothetical protein [Marinicella sediminis]
MISMKDAQQDMRTAYLGGATGMLVSGLVWLTAGLVGWQLTVKASVLTLFFGGMLIHPLGVLLDKAMKRAGQHQKGNPLAPLALESTVLLFIGLFIAFVAVQSQPTWFYPIMLLTIGGRYLLFQTLYGMKAYWLIGGALLAAGALCLVYKTPFVTGAFVGAGIEIVGSWLIFSQVRFSQS